MKLSPKTSVPYANNSAGPRNNLPRQPKCTIEPSNERRPLNAGFGPWRSPKPADGDHRKRSMAITETGHGDHRKR